MTSKISRGDLEARFGSFGIGRARKLRRIAPVVMRRRVESDGNGRPEGWPFHFA